MRRLGSVLLAQVLGVAMLLVLCVLALSKRIVGDGELAGELPGQLTLIREAAPQAPSLNGLPTCSDTYNPADQGTAWPVDAFTGMVSGHISPQSIGQPAMHSYDGDGNMEGLSAFGPFSHQENRTDLGNYTGAVGPAGGSTPESHPELTAP